MQPRQLNRAAFTGKQHNYIYIGTYDSISQGFAFTNTCIRSVKRRGGGRESFCLWFVVYPKLSSACSSMAFTEDFDIGPFLNVTATVALGRSMR